MASARLVPSMNGCLLMLTWRSVGTRRAPSRELRPPPRKARPPRSLHARPAWPCAQAPPNPSRAGSRPCPWPPCGAGPAEALPYFGRAYTRCRLLVAPVGTATPPWRRQVQHAPIALKTSMSPLARPLLTAPRAFVCPPLAPLRAGRGVCPAQAAGHRPASPRPRALRHLRRAHRGHLRRAPAALRDGRLRALPRVRRLLPGLRALPLRRRRARRPRGLLVQAARAVSELRRASDVRRGREHHRLHPPQRARAAVGALAALRAPRPRGDEAGRPHRAGPHLRRGGRQRDPARRRRRRRGDGQRLVSPAFRRQP